MIPLDAVAIFPNIPLELVKKAFPNRWIKVISPILAKIVMEDLERSVFERLGFVVPFYFRYVDDTLLCVLWLSCKQL